MVVFVAGMGARPLFRLGLLAAVVGAVFVSTAAAADEPAVRDGIAWCDIRGFGVEGQGFADTKAPYDRLPARAEGTVRDAVWSLSRHSAGLCVRFVTASPAIHAHWKLTSSRLEMPHMPSTGVSGLDLYGRDGHGKWRWIACASPTGEETSKALAQGLPAAEREYLLYLPLYNGVSVVEVGVPAGETVKSAPPRPEERVKPIVYYGTSITHGACASRPGMVHTAILQRRYDRPCVNLGFSGNGRMEPEVVSLIAEIDAAVYVIDCCPNLGPDEVAARTGPLVVLLRKTRPETPIVLVEDRVYGDSWIHAGKAARNRGNHAALRAEFEKLVAAGDRNLYYIPGDGLLGDDDEGTVDSSHPTDLGFLRQADAFDKVLAPLAAR